MSDVYLVIQYTATREGLRMKSIIGAYSTQEGAEAVQQRCEQHDRCAASRGFVGFEDLVYWVVSLRVDL